RQQLMALLRLRERNDHFRKRWRQPLRHPSHESGLPHLEPGLGSSHAATLAAGEHEQRRLHGDYHRPAVRAIDFHVHLPTPDWLDKSMKGYIEAAEAYFRYKVVRRSL